jgi:hypothetical protein
MKNKLHSAISLLMVFCFLALTSLTASADRLPPWTRANPVPPNPTMANLTALTEFNGEIYAATMSEAGYMDVTVNSAIYKSRDGRHWQKVSQDGMGDPVNNTSLFTLATFQGKLYVGTGKMEGGGIAQIWRTSNGKKWEAVDTAGLGDSANYLIGSLAVFQGRLYAATWNSGKGVQLYRSATGNPGSWKKATSLFDDAGFAANGTTGFITYNNQFYMAVEGPGEGIYRSKDGSAWSAVTPAGFGDPAVDGSGSFAIFNKQLYFGSGNFVTGGKIWRTQDGKNWSNVMAGGFGDANNYKVESLVAFNDGLFAFTSNWTTGVEAWRSGDGSHWEQVNQDAFNVSCTPFDLVTCNWGISNGKTALVFQETLYIGTWNPQGGEILTLDADH